MTSSEEIKSNRIQRGLLATAQQRKASNPKKSVWVQASAGTGKTKVLSDRVLRILLNGCPPSRILCLTYTKAAAVEMNQRISGRLSKWAVMSQEELDHELESLLGDLPKEAEKFNRLEAMARRLFAVLLDTPGGMKIQTIHSFCQDILKRFPLEAHISPYFEVMDERSSTEALEEIRKNMLAEVENHPTSSVGQALSYLTTHVSEFSFPKIMKAITDARNKIAALLAKYQSSEAILQELSKRMKVDFSKTEDELMAEFEQGTDWDAFKPIMMAWERGGTKDKAKAECLYKILATHDICKYFDDYCLCFMTQKGQPLASFGTKAAVAFYPELIDFCEQEVKRLQDLATQKMRLHLFESTKAVLLLAEDLILGYNRFKQQHSKLDYEDLIALTRRLLESPNVPQWVMFKLDGGIDNILIDEAQDTSPDQWAIVKALTSGFFDDIGAGEKARTVFAVGDRKQSIYSFQGADPREFEKMRYYFAEMLAETKAFDDVNLAVSFRSTDAVLDTVNTLFSDEEVKKGVVAEGEDIIHVPFRIGDGGKIELWGLTEPKEDENQETWLPPVERVTSESTSSRLAQDIAQRIHNMVTKKEILLSKNRPFCYRDFMILVQRRNSFIEELVRACKNVGVTITGVDKIKLSEQIAVQDLISLGRFLLLPSDDLSLAEVLKSPIFGLDDDDLFKLCYKRGSGVSVWSRLAAKEEYKKEYNILQELCNLAEKVRPFELYSHLLNCLGARKKFIARLGVEAEDGIDEFINLTLAFEQEHIPDLQGFIQWMSQDDVEIKRELEQSEADAVRIMTVHGSKGLQAPVVILPDTIRVPSVRKEAAMLWDDVFYYPLSAKDYDERCSQIKEDEKIATLEEYRRLLYVALTRAEDRLCLCGYYKSARSKPSENCWYSLCQQALEKIASPTKKDMLVYETEQTIEAKEAKKIEHIDAPLPKVSWLVENAQEEGALARPLMPSKMEDEPSLLSPLGDHGENRYRRGLIIHKLLQFIPESDVLDKEAIIEGFLDKNAPEMAEAEKSRICEEVISLIENPLFAPLFAKGSKAEVPIMGLYEGKIISGQVDRLVVTDNEVMIVDYKTNRPAAKSLADVPSAYWKQLEAYRHLLAKVYPDKKIATYILWTDTANLMQIE